MGVFLKLNENAVSKKVMNEDFGLFLANEWKKLIDPYTPQRTGVLKTVTELRPFEIKYNSPYARYIYEGMLMVDPKTGKGAFFKEGYGFWSRPGVAKQLTDTPLNYSTEMSPFASAHWDKAAQKAGQKDKLVAAANRYLQRKG